MLLRIIDKPADNDSNDAIEIVFENGDTCDRYVTDSYDSPITENFRKTLTWYFQDYPHILTDDINDKGVVEKVIRFGQHMGDQLLGEDHELTKIIDIVETEGYHQLTVQIESSRRQFFTELWEIAVLHESKYVLSTVTKAYTRKFLVNNKTRDYPERQESLQVTSPVAAQLNSEMNPEGIKQESQDDEPLRILHLVSRPQSLDFSFTTSNAFNRSIETFATEGAIDYKLFPCNSWEQLQARLADKARPIHIIHYDGPVLLEGGKPSFILGYQEKNESTITCEQFAKTMVENQVTLLGVEARMYLNSESDKDQSTNAALGLAAIAEAANNIGLGNVIGLNQVTDPWTSGLCFQAVYQRLVLGLSTAQAVVEARKALQAQTETHNFTAKTLPFHYWSLLVHYGGQTVHYFNAAQIYTGLEESQFLAQTRQKLLGFKANMLPPELFHVSDNQLLQIISLINNSHSAIGIIGQPGTGRTHLTHSLACYLKQKNAIEYGFYFDFSNGFYSRDDMLQMIAPVLELSPDQQLHVEEKLQNLRCCFVLDNLFTTEPDDTTKNEEWQQLSELMYSLHNNGHIVITTGIQSAEKLINLPFCNVDLKTLNPIEQKVLAVNCLQQAKLTEKNEDNQWEDLLLSLKGQPFLIKRTLPLLKNLTPAELKTNIATHIGETEESNADIVNDLTNVVEKFYQWQWDELNPLWQRLLLLCANVDGLLLEMVMIACDQKESFSPAKELFSVLGDKDINFSDVIDLWEEKGFVNRLPYGRIIDSRCNKFLKKQQVDLESSLSDEEQAEIETVSLHFSQIICEGIRLLTQHVFNQPNTAISHNLLMNRRHWVSHFERLWFAGDFRGFMGSKNIFDQLLQQERLQTESAAWSLDLLKRTHPFPSDDDASDEAKLSWLALAAQSLNQVESETTDIIQQGAKIWRNWFDALGASVDQNQLPLFKQATTFLETYYQKLSEWQACIGICQKSYDIYKHYESWIMVVQSLQSLAKYHVAIDQRDDALSFEDRIVNEIPYENAPPGFQSQQLVDVTLARVARNELEPAQQLLDKLRTFDDARAYNDMLDGIQADIHYQAEDFKAALPYYCKLWIKSIKLEQKPYLKQLKSRFCELEEKLGIEEFDKLYQDSVEDDITHPRDYTG